MTDTFFISNEAIEKDGLHWVAAPHKMQCGLKIIGAFVDHGMFSENYVQQLSDFDWKVYFLNVLSYFFLLSCRPVKFDTCFDLKQIEKDGLQRLMLKCNAKTGRHLSADPYIGPVLWISFYILTFLSCR